ncbi:hydantoinase B/oxoprolinase family protein [Chloroflexota bacterium]
MNNNVTVEPMTISIIENRLYSLALQMGLRVVRAAYSYVTAHIRDVGTAIFDEDERVLTQGNWMPVHVAGANMSLKNILDYVGRENIAPGDFILGNDPYTVKAGHQPDWSFVYPVFHEGQLVSYLYLRTHVLDTGGAYVGCYWPRAYDVHSESLIIPPIKIFKGGKKQEDVYKLILKNVRQPSLMNMDLMLVRASMLKVAEEVEEMYKTYGRDVMKAGADQLISLSEKSIREAISKWPAGVYKAERAADSDGSKPDPVWVRLTLTIKPEEGELIFDYSECDKQVDFINLAAGHIWSFTITPLKWSLPPGIPDNNAIYGCVKILTKPGTVVNPTYPASCGGQGPHIGIAVLECVQQALAQAIPKEVPACWTRTLSPILQGKNPFVRDPNTGVRLDYFISNFHSAGTAGAMWGYDGWDGLGNAENSGAVIRSPIEIDERDFPYRFLCSEWITDSAGHGQFRGGQGAHAQYLNIHDPATFSRGDANVYTGNSDGEKFAPFGLMGGLDSGKAKMVIRRGQKNIRLHTVDMVQVQPGDIIMSWSPGGGGVGNPLEREIEKVQEDARNEYISVKVAREIYGVVLNPETFEIDNEATKKLRARKRRAKKAR